MERKRKSMHSRWSPKKLAMIPARPLKWPRLEEDKEDEFLKFLDAGEFIVAIRKNNVFHSRRKH